MQQQSATGKPISTEALWASMSAAHQAGNPAAQVPAEAVEAHEIAETTEVSATQSEAEAPSQSPVQIESALASTAPAVQPNDAEVIAALAVLEPLEYDRVRKEQANALGVQVSTLDALVKKARKEEVVSPSLPFSEVEPHPEPIDPALLLSEISGTIRRFIVLTKEQADAAALWIALTWFILVVSVAPLMLISAPEKACGKSQLLELIGRMSAKFLFGANITTAVLFRLIEKCTPTLLMDEVDTFIRENEEIKGLINAGHTRTSAFVWRIVGENHEPKAFSVWGAKAMAGIALEKHLPDSTMSRGIVFNLRRKMAHETVERLRHADIEVFEVIASKLARFAQDYSQKVRLARPNLPNELNDRAQDNWEPLLAIAGCAGAEWVARATAAALKLSGDGENAVSTGNELLADIRRVFERKHVVKISTMDLIDALCADEEAAWATYNRGKPLTPRQLAKQLAAYEISSKTVRLGHANTPKGYDAAQFADVFARYLAAPENLPQQRNGSQESMSGMDLGVADAKGVAATEGSGATQETWLGMGCGGVAEISQNAGGIRPDATDDAFNIY